MADLYTWQTAGLILMVAIVAANLYYEMRQR